MKNTYSLFITLLSSLMLGSCAFHSGNISTGYMPDCPITEIATGTSSTFHILPLVGGLNKEALILEAKKDLYRNYRITDKIKISNFSVDFRTTYFLIFVETKCTVSADVFDCNQKLDTTTRLTGISLGVKGFVKGDSVFYSSERGFTKKAEKGIITQAKDNYAIIELPTKIKNVKYDVIFKINREDNNVVRFGYNIGDIVTVKLYSPTKGSYILSPCKVTGLGYYSLLVQYETESHEIRKIIVGKALLGK